jgi:nucleoid DNA-binding protein
MIARRYGLPYGKAEELVKSIFTYIGDILAEGEKVCINRFGTFEPFKAAPREGIDPTGEPYFYPGAKRIRFKPSVTLKRQIQK